MKHRQVDIAGLALFRVAFGICIVWEVGRYWFFDWINYLYIAPKFFFSYPGFEWLKPLPGLGMYVVFTIIGICGLLITVGLFYQFACTLFFLLFSYVFLLDQSHYLNHFYLISLIGFLLIFIPADEQFSLKSLQKINPSKTCSSYFYSILRLQIGIPYFFGGIAKINSEWLSGQPLTEWLQKSQTGLFQDFLSDPATGLLLSLCSLFFDLFIVFFLLFKPTRVAAFLIVLFFNLTNAILFDIGIFPWLMIFASTIFFEPSWPRTFIRYPKTPIQIAIVFPRPMVILFVLYFCVQTLLPLRHWLYPGNVLWTQRGQKFSWMMKLSNLSSATRFYAELPNSKQRIQINYKGILTEKQAVRMRGNPRLIRQFAKFLGEKLKEKTGGHVPIYVHSVTQLNQNKPQLRIDPNADLTQEWLEESWIRPFQEQRQQG